MRDRLSETPLYHRSVCVIGTARQSCPRDRNSRTVPRKCLTSALRASAARVERKCSTSASRVQRAWGESALRDGLVHVIFSQGQCLASALHVRASKCLASGASQEPCRGSAAQGQSACSASAALVCRKCSMCASRYRASAAQVPRVQRKRSASASQVPRKCLASAYKCLTSSSQRSAAASQVPRKCLQYRTRASAARVERKRSAMPHRSIAGATQVPRKGSASASQVRRKYGALPVQRKCCPQVERKRSAGE